ncbi:unnamed protein product [Nippostrongylus brasiliensis]|uniref:CCHC-type domain-containing protein n=1 Tax=Nippostrongylus brasiliensis TaxID=27835 RepID=A0A0N4XQ43_NIPBR|nr:unnamed protein product [Nippostrongylus brasiliensis]
MHLESQRHELVKSREPKCFGCGRLGHLKTNCPSKGSTPADRKPPEPSVLRGDPKIFTASLNRWACGTTGTDDLLEDLVGEQATDQVQLGMTRTALLDTDSQIIIIPRADAGERTAERFRLGCRRRGNRH